jgi:FemAB-related protein (PEP-CTERM system-associated)
VVTAVGAPAPLVTSWSDGLAWDRFVSDAQDGTMAHRWAWTRIVAAAYGHQVLPLAAVRDGSLAGVLPLVLIRSRLFGRHVVSMPYLDYGGLCTGGDHAAERALVAAALELARSRRARLELRHLVDRAIGLPASLHKVTMTLDLSGGEDAVWSSIRSNRRGQVRKARRNGLRVSIHGMDGLDDFYKVMATNMRDLGSPVHRRKFYREILAGFGEDARIILAHDRDQAVGAGMVLFHGGRTVLPWSSSLRSSFSRGPNQLLYWEAVRYGIERGCHEFDFGRSSRDSGTFESKREWGAEAVQLFWHHDPEEEPAADGDGDGQRLEWATRVWRRLPVRAATIVGAMVRGGLPN